MLVCVSKLSLSAGWISIDQTLVSNAMGHRAVFLTDDTGIFNSMDEMRAKSSGVIKCICILIKCAVQACVCVCVCLCFTR